MSEYKVVSNGDGTYTIFNNEVIVPNACLKQIYFPEITSHTLHGEVHHVAGPCKAVISVPEIEGNILEVSVEFK